MGGVADDPKRGKRQPGLGGIFRRNVAFHIDGGSAGLQMQRLLEVTGGNHLFGACQASPDDAPAP